MPHHLQTLIARLLALRSLPRHDALVQRALTDEAFRQELDQRLAQCGLQLLDNPYAEHVAVGLLSNLQEPVFGDGVGWLSQHCGLQKDGVALLMVLWALIILPKRERQILRQDKTQPQADLFSSARPLPRGAAVSEGIAEAALLADFGERLGGKMRINVNLGILARLGFISRRRKTIHEGPLLDVLFDYATLAPRLLEGVLADLLAQHSAPPPAAD